MRHHVSRLRLIATVAATVVGFGVLSGATNAQNAGALDTSFDSDGRADVKLVTGNTDQATTLVNYPGRRYLAVGRCNDSAGNVPCFFRLNDDGSADATFGSGGKVVGQLIAGFRMLSNAIAVQPDGRILVAGACTPTAGGGALPCHARLLANGQIDGSYGSAGSVVITLASNVSSDAAGVAVQNDGKVVVTGTCWDVTHGFCAWRYFANGAVDTGYGTGGNARVVITANNFAATGLLLTPDDAAIVYGYCDYGSGSTANFCLVRFTAAGLRDTSYVGGSGVPTLPHHAGGAASEGPSAAVLQPDGGVALAGICVDGSTLRACAARVTAAGALDTSFAGGWSLPSNAALGAQSEGTGIALQRDGKLVLSAGCVDRNKVCTFRLNTDGSLDVGYGTGGVMAVTTSGYATAVAGALLDADERLLISGGCYGNDGGGITDACVYRVLRGQSYAGRNCTLDVDDDGTALGANDLLFMARVAMGFTGTAVTNGITPTALARRTSGTSIRDYLVTQCGMTQPR